MSLRDGVSSVHPDLLLPDIQTDRQGYLDRKTGISRHKDIQTDEDIQTDKDIFRYRRTRISIQTNRQTRISRQTDRQTRISRQTDKDIILFKEAEWSTSYDIFGHKLRLSKVLIQIFQIYIQITFTYIYTERFFLKRLK